MQMMGRGIGNIALEGRGLVIDRGGVVFLVSMADKEEIILYNNLV